MTGGGESEFLLMAGDVILFRKGWSALAQNLTGTKLIDANPGYRAVIQGIIIAPGLTDKEDVYATFFFGTNVLSYDKVFAVARVQAASESADNIGFANGGISYIFPDMTVYSQENQQVTLATVTVRTGSTCYGTIWGYYQTVR